ncbi:MAG: response regulator [Patescibacteria group bacterium]|nr:response regulator [Patescibacteria group bacterium]
MSEEVKQKIKTSKKILIIEDDKFLAKMLTKMLESHGYEIVVASSGREGLLKASTEEPKLVLLDIILPDIDGFDILETIKTDDKTKKTPVIILSNLGQQEDIQQGKNLGAQDYLVKSEIKLDQVVDKVRKYLPVVK